MNGRDQEQKQQRQQRVTRCVSELQAGKLDANDKKQQS